MDRAFSRQVRWTGDSGFAGAARGGSRCRGRDDQERICGDCTGRAAEPGLLTGMAVMAMFPRSMASHVLAPGLLSSYSQ